MLLFETPVFMGDNANGRVVFDEGIAPDAGGGIMAEGPRV